MKRHIFLVLLFVLAAACSRESEEPPMKPELAGDDADYITGQLDYYRGMEGEGLLPRDVIVWTPPGYGSDPGRRYGVLYMHDGQNVFDPRTSYIGKEWRIDESVDRLVREGVIEPMIVVGLANTPERTADYSPGPRGEAYMDFLVHTVKPMIDENYRTLPGKQHTLTGGSSMGGLISCMLGWRYPETFGAVLCFSPAFKVEGVDDWSGFFIDSGDDRRDVFFYVDNGGVDLEERLQPGIDDMLSFWKEAGYRAGQDFVFVKDPQAEHSEPAWAERFPWALQRALEGASR